MTDALMLGVLIGAVSAAAPAVYLAVRVALAELPDPKPPAPLESAPVSPIASWQMSDKKCTPSCEKRLPVGNVSGLCGQCGYELLVRERQLAQLERANHALQPFGLYMAAGKRGDQ